LRNLLRWCSKVKDVLLVVLHAADVFAESCVLARLGSVALESEHGGNIFLFVLVLGLCDALFEIQVEVVIELFKFGLVHSRLVVQEADESLREDLTQLLDKVGVLEELPGQVKWYVLTVYHALHEAHPPGKNLVGVVQNEHFLTVQGHAYVTVLANVIRTLKQESLS